MSDEDKEKKPSKKVPPFILFKGPKLLELGFQHTYEEMGGPEGRLDIKVHFVLNDEDKDDEAGKWYIDLLDTETGENCGSYNHAHCPDPLNPDCE